MLVLSRKNGQELVISDLGIRVKVISSSKGRVKLGIEAPEEIKIQRAEATAQPTRKAVTTEYPSMDDSRHHIPIPNLST